VRKVNPAADHVFLGADLLNKSKGRGDRATVDSTKTKASHHLGLLAQLRGAGCPKAESWWEGSSSPVS